MTMSKPNQLQLDIAKKMLKKEDTKFCGGCLKEDDHSYNSETVQWIQYDSCLLWMHLSCTVPKPDEIPDNYICQFCNTKTNDN